MSYFFGVIFFVISLKKFNNKRILNYNKTMGLLFDLLLNLQKKGREMIFLVG